MPADIKTTAGTGSAGENNIDTRQQALQQWLLQAGISAPGVPASSDASFRRYFRFAQADHSVIAMDAPPETEDCRPFVKVAKLLREAGVTVPEILAEDLEQGFLLLSDLGSQTYLQHMQSSAFAPQQADDMFTRAIEALLKMQHITALESLPRYDEALLRRELNLFPEWYLQHHLQRPAEGELAELLHTLFRQLIDAVTSQAYVFVHRDFMPRNLMVMTGDVGVLDFQDAVAGPISYDPTCLFRDAFISWPEQRVEQWLRQYWQRALQEGLPVPGAFEDFQYDCDVMGVQRHIKVIGIFARICYRDGKPHYLQDVPRFFGYLREVAKRRPELALGELLSLLGEWR